MLSLCFSCSSSVNKIFFQSRHYWPIPPGSKGHMISVIWSKLPVLKVFFVSVLKMTDLLQNVMRKFIDVYKWMNFKDLKLNSVCLSKYFCFSVLTRNWSFLLKSASLEVKFDPFEASTSQRQKRIRLSSCLTDGPAAVLVPEPVAVSPEDVCPGPSHRNQGDGLKRDRAGRFGLRRPERRGRSQALHCSPNRRFWSESWLSEFRTGPGGPRGRSGTGGRFWGVRTGSGGPECKEPRILIGAGVTTAAPTQRGWD